MTIRTMEVVLMGGPMNGQHITLPASAESFHIGSKGRPFFKYTYAGKMDARTYFAITLRRSPMPRVKAPNGFRSPMQPAVGKRAAAKFLFTMIGALGRDPRIEAEFAKTKPVVGGTRLKHGRGAQRRKENRERRAS